MLRLVAENGARKATCAAQPVRRNGVRVVKSIGEWLINGWRIRRATEQLRSWDDHMLRDIGLTRAEIDQVERHGRGHRESQ